MSDAPPVEVTDVAFHVDHRKPVASWRFTEKRGAAAVSFTVTRIGQTVWAESRHDGDSPWRANTFLLTPATAARLAAALTAASAYKETS